MEWHQPFYDYLFIFYSSFLLMQHQLKQYFVTTNTHRLFLRSWYPEISNEENRRLCKVCNRNRTIRMISDLGSTAFARDGSTSVRRFGAVWQEACFVLFTAMKSIIVIMFLMELFSLIWAASNPCNSAITCGQCISIPNCAWCSQTVTLSNRRSLYFKQHLYPSI